ncbi:hypothetical protein C8R45DRAFT_1102026 [Mycena sanguinolenta]|nr:hypothetical protein C8R45DRAFT_1102026 [Mycena sanguinolenta]
MADAILLDSDVPFDTAEWIGVGKLYKDIPIEVSDACCDARKIPVDLQATLPSMAMPVTKCLAIQLPGILDSFQKILTKTNHWFSFKPPNCDSSHTLWSHSIPALSFLLELENDYAQNWMNGAVSVVNPPEKFIRFPLFAVTFYREIHRLREAQTKWNSSVRWARTKFAGSDLEIFAQVSWNTVHSDAPDGQLDWTRLVDDEWLSGGIIDSMMADIQSRATRKKAARRVKK